MRWLYLLLFILLWNTASAFQSIVILPFSNRSEKEQVYWLGEGFAESLSEELLLHDALVLQRRQRIAAYEDLHLPYTGELSRATMLKIADKLAADYVIFGSFNLKDTNLEVELKVVRTTNSELSPPIQATGSLDRLYQVQLALRDGLVKYFNSRKVLAESVTAFPDQSVPLHAYELYIKGLLENSNAEKLKFFQQAVEANHGYPQATYRLGLSLSGMGRYRESTEALKEATFEGLYKDRANFLIGMNDYFSGDFEGAYQVWLELSKTQPTAEIYNNIGLALMKKSDLQGAGWYLSKAVEQSPLEPDYHFNLACSYVQRGYDKQAVQQYRDAVNGRPTDYHALYLISKLLERDTDPTLKDLVSKRVSEIFQETVPADQKDKFPDQYNSVGQLLRPAAQFLSQEERDYANVSLQRAGKERADIVKAYENRAAGYVDKDDPASAIQELKKGASLNPFGWHLHHLWGRSLLLQKNDAAAIGALEFSIWCLDNIDSHLVLADMYKQAERYADSKVQIQRSLALDPQNKKALEIWSKISDKQ